MVGEDYVLVSLAKYHTLQDEVAKLKDKLSRMTEEREAEIRRLRAELYSAKTTISHLQQQNGLLAREAGKC